MMESIAQQAAKDARDVFSDDRQAQAAIGYMEQLIYAALRNVEYDFADPVTVHANMLRGSIAKPTVEQIVHLYGVDALTAALAPMIVREAGIEPVAAPAEDAAAKGETDGETLERLGMDGAKWAAEFRTTALRLGYSDMDEGWLIGWFCNAVMAGYDRSPAPDPAAIREAALRECEKALRDWQDNLNAHRSHETAITVGMAADLVLALIEKGAADDRA